MNEAEIAAAIQGGPAIIQAIGFLLQQFKHGPVRQDAAQHLQNIAAVAAAAPASVSPQDVQTSMVDNNPGEDAVVRAAGETFGEEYTVLTVQGPQDMQSQLLSFEQSLGQIFEVVGYRIPATDQVMGVNREVVGAVAGGTGDVQHDRMALISAVGSPDNGSTVAINVQVKLERLINQKQSGWLSFKQVLEGGF